MPIGASGPLSRRVGRFRVVDWHGSGDERTRGERARRRAAPAPPPGSALRSSARRRSGSRGPAPRMPDRSGRVRRSRRSGSPAPCGTRARGRCGSARRRRAPPGPFAAPVECLVEEAGLAAARAHDHAVGSRLIRPLRDRRRERGRRRRRVGAEGPGQRDPRLLQVHAEDAAARRAEQLHGQLPEQPEADDDEALAERGRRTAHALQAQSRRAWRPRRRARGRPGGRRAARFTGTALISAWFAYPAPAQATRSPTAKRVTSGSDRDHVASGAVSERRATTAGGPARDPRSGGRRPIAPCPTHGA